jgi:3-oxoacid CoA-transferase subunit A
VKGLTVISNNAGVDGFGLGLLLETRQIEDDLVLCRREQGVRAPVSVRRAATGIQPAGHAGRTLPRRRRGHPGFYTKTGVGTLVAEGKEHKEFNGETYILETGLVADLSIVKAWKADPHGNLSSARPRATSIR